MIELLKDIIWKMTIFVVVLLALVSIRILYKLKNFPHSKSKLFINLTCLGMIAYSIGEILYVYYEDAFPSPADIFYVIGQILFFISFVYLYNIIDKKKLSFKDKELITFVVILTFSILFFLSFKIILPNLEDESSLAIFLTFFFPITSAIMFIFIYLCQTHSNKKKGFIFYLLLEGFLAYLGDMVFVYADWTDVTYGIKGLIYDSLYILGYMFLLLGLLLFYNRITSSNEIRLE